MRSKILNQYRTELGRKVWGQYACGERKYGTRHNLMAFSCRPDFKTSSVMRGGQSKAVCMCATLYKGGGNNSVTYIIEFYEN